MSIGDDLSQRFGPPDNYEESFLTMDQRNLREDFDQFNAFRGKSSDKHERSRQHFLNLLAQHRLIWYSTDSEFDFDVEVSRIYKQDHEYLAFMRILCHGYRAERAVPNGIEMVFHVLIGRVIFNYRKKTKTLSRGQCMNIAPRSTYSIKSLDKDQPAYLIFRVSRVKKNRPRATVQDPEVIVLD